MVKMLHDNVLVLPIENEKKTSGGIYIPSTTNDMPTKGKVISVGKKDAPMEVKEGDIVVFGKYNGSEIKLDNINYLILKQEHIYCVIEE